MTLYEDIVINDNPFSYWRLDDDGLAIAHDVYGVNPGNYSGSPTLNQLGVLAYSPAVYFDGVDDKITFTTSTSLPTGNSAYTIELWMFPLEMASQFTFRGIIGWGAYAGTRDRISLHLRTDGISVEWGNQELFYANADLARKWSHVATTYDGTTRRIYVNGVQVASDVPGVANNATSANWQIAKVEGGGQFYKGLLDEIALYNSAKSPTVIQQHYNAGLLSRRGVINTALIQAYPNWFIGNSISPVNQLKLSSLAGPVNEQNTSSHAAYSGGNLLATLTVTSKEVRNHGAGIFAASVPAGTGTGNVKRIGLFAADGSLYSETNYEYTKAAGDDHNIFYWISVL